MVLLRPRTNKTVELQRLHTKRSIRGELVVWILQLERNIFENASDGENRPAPRPLCTIALTLAIAKAPPRRLWEFIPSLAQDSLWYEGFRVFKHLRVTINCVENGN